MEDLAEALRENEELYDKIQQLEAENRRLKDDRDQAVAAQAEVVKAASASVALGRRQAEATKDELAEEKYESTHGKSLIEDLKTKFRTKQLRTQIEMEAEHSQDLQLQVEQAQAKASRLQEEKASLQRELVGCKCQVQQDQAELEMLRAKLREEDEALETEREAHRLEVQRLREELEDVQVACGNGKLAGCLHEEEDLHGRFSRTSDSLAAQLGGAASSQESDEEEPRVEHRGSGVLPAEFARVQDELRKQTAAAEVAQRECLLLREQLGDAEALKLEFVRLQERLAVADGIRCECVQLQEQLAAAELAQWEAAHLPEQLAIGAAQSESAELRTKLDSAQRECQRLRKQVSFTDQIKRQNTLLREQQRTVHATQRRLAQWHDEPAIGEPSSDEVQQSERAQPRGHAGVAEEAEPRHVEVRERLVVEQIQQCGVQLQAQPIGVGACQQTSLELQERTAAASREHSECAQLREQLSAYAGVCEEHAQLRSHLAEQEATRHLCVELREQLTGTEDAQLQCEQLREQLAAAEQVKLECAQLQQQLAIAERAQHGCVYLRKQLELVEGEHGECKLLQDQCSAHEGSRRPLWGQGEPLAAGKLAQLHERFATAKGEQIAATQAASQECARLQQRLAVAEDDPGRSFGPAVAVEAAPRYAAPLEPPAAARAAQLSCALLREHLLAAEGAYQECESLRAQLVLAEGTERTREREERTLGGAGEEVERELRKHIARLQRELDSARRSALQTRLAAARPGWDSLLGSFSCLCQRERDPEAAPAATVRPGPPKQLPPASSLGDSILCRR